MMTPQFMPEQVGLQSELFQLLQAAVYHADGLWGEATFDLYLRDLPPDYGYVVFAGLQTAAESIARLRFTEAEVSWLRRHPLFAQTGDYFFETLRELRFTGDIDAMPEGTVAVSGQPVLRVTAPLHEAGLIETRLIQTIAHATAVATRAARLVEAAAGRPIYDLGGRRCAGPEAAWAAARAAWIGGTSATTNALASATLGLPGLAVLSETMLAAYPDPAAAYEVLRVHAPAETWIDLPDLPLQAAVARMAPLRETLRGVRLDDDELGPRSRELRAALDQAGMGQVRLLGSGSLDEGHIAALVAAGAPLDAFAVGAALTVGSGRPLHFSYRLAEMYRGAEPTPARGRLAAPYPGRKQVVRERAGDILCLEHEAASLGGEALLLPVMRAGELLAGEPLAAARDRCAAGIAALPAGVRRLVAPARWPVRLSQGVLRPAR
ncbi:MAG: nicotinate phosphoribosyltransferase [Myxococcota bacterium]|jgi:nicotinate phosphoribosyltransferase